MSNKTKSIIYFILTTIAVGALAVYGYMTSDFSKIKKYDNNNIRDDFKSKIAQERHYSTDVKIKNDGMLHLGHFEINISNNKKLIANISLKYTIPSDIWKNSKAKKEMLNNGPVIRNIIIETILNKKFNDILNDRIKDEIINNINPYLTNTKIEAIYFNKFIVSD